MKSGKHWALIEPRDSQQMLNSDNSMDHVESRPAKSGFCKIFWIEQSVQAMTAMTDKATFSTIW